MVTTSNPETIALHTGYRADETTGARHLKADDERQPLWLFGNAVVIAAVIAWFAVILPVFRPVALFAMDETYYFVLRQLSSVQDFVGYAVSLY